MRLTREQETMLRDLQMVGASSAEIEAAVRVALDELADLRQVVVDQELELVALRSMTPVPSQDRTVVPRTLVDAARCCLCGSTAYQSAQYLWCTGHDCPLGQVRLTAEEWQVVHRRLRPEHLDSLRQLVDDESLYLKAGYEAAIRAVLYEAAIRTVLYEPAIRAAIAGGRTP